MASWEPSESYNYLLSPLDPSLVNPSQVVFESNGVVEVCVNGGRDTVPVVMEVLDTSSASSEEGDFVVLGSEERLLRPGNVSCFSLRILDDDLNEHSEDIQLRFTQGEGDDESNAIFELDGLITILDNDFSEKLQNYIAM